MLISAVICTRNPRPDYFARTLAGLRQQKLPVGDWELMIVDNNSDEPLAARLDLTWHPSSKIVREDKPGLTPARMKGIESSVGEVLVFIDDDNVLQEDYLKRSADIATQWPILGAWGASIVGEFEAPPPAALAPYLEGLAISELDQACWSNIPIWSKATPYGAGVCVRREVAEAYLKAARETHLRQALGRAGANLGAGDDSDLSWTSTRLNLGFGRFPELQLTHLISARRLTLDYMASLFAGFAGSGIILDHLWSRPIQQPHIVIELLRLSKTLLTSNRLQRMIAWRSFLARRKAWRLLENPSIHQTTACPKGPEE